MEMTGRLFGYGSVWEQFLAWREGRRIGELCMAYGGTWSDRVRVCDKPRGHFDSHTYEFIDQLTAAEGQ
jgi:hypothetical protein